MQSSKPIKQGQLDAGAWVDYSSITTFNGASSFTDKTLRYNIKGNTLFFYFNIQGVSNSTTKSFTLPEINTGDGYLDYGIGLINNGGSATNTGRMRIINGSNVVDFKINSSGSNFTASGIFAIVGSGFIQIN